MNSLLTKNADPIQVRETYQQFYKLRNKNPEWTNNWQEFAEDMHAAKREHIVKRIMRNSYKSICDYGCGTGYLISRLRKSGFNGRLVGVDINIPPILEKRAKNYELEIHKKNFIRFKEKFDAFIFFSALHFARLAEIPTILKNNHYCPQVYIVEAFIDHPENTILDEKLSELTAGKNHLLKEADLNYVFANQEYSVTEKYTFPKEVDPMARVFTLIQYSLEGVKYT